MSAPLSFAGHPMSSNPVDDAPRPGLFDWIWHIRGEIPLAPGQTSEDAFDRVAPLFDARGTSHRRMGDTLTFDKKDPDAQDKMAVFDRGTLTVDRNGPAPALRYHLVSRALLLCFLAPLMFLSFAAITIAVGKMDTPAKEEAAKKKPEKKDVQPPQSVIDKWLGAPAPESLKKKADDANKKDDKKTKPTSAYVFAGIFAVLYLIGRFLEDRLIKAQFRKRLLGA